MEILESIEKSNLLQFFKTFVNTRKYGSLPPKSIMSSPFLTNMKEEKNINVKTRVGSTMKAKGEYTEKNTREVIISKMIKEVMGYVQDCGGNNRFKVKFKDGQKICISSYLFGYLFS